MGATTMSDDERAEAQRRYSRESQARRRAGEPRRYAAVAECGTRAGAKAHRRKSEPVCDACKAAEAAHARELYRRRKATGD